MIPRPGERQPPVENAADRVRIAQAHAVGDSLQAVFRPAGAEDRDTRQAQGAAARCRRQLVDSHLPAGEVDLAVDRAQTVREPRQAQRPVRNRHRPFDLDIVDRAADLDVQIRGAGRFDIGIETFQQNQVEPPVRGDIDGALAVESDRAVDLDVGAASLRVIESSRTMPPP